MNLGFVATMFFGFQDLPSSAPGIGHGSDILWLWISLDVGVLGLITAFILACVVVGDTVGDPFKDTADPSLQILIKLLATITLALAPLSL